MNIIMDSIIVGIIIMAALFFTIRGFVKIFRGEKKCRCSKGCECTFKESCNTVFPMAED